MADSSSQMIESAPIASIQSLKSRFEQFALNNASASTNSANSKPLLVPPVSAPPQAHTAVAPDSSPTPRSKPRASLPPEDGNSQCHPVAPVPDLPSSSRTSPSDPNAAALKRAPPPPPPSRTKKSSPIVSPLLRPVPAPGTLRSPRASPERELLTVQQDYRNKGTEESSEDGPSGSVSSLRHRFSSPTQISTSRSSPPRPVTPRLPPRPPMMTSQSDLAPIEHPPPALPPRYIQSPSSEISIEISAVNASPRVGTVAALRGRFTSMDNSKPTSRDDNLSEPNILITSPPILPIRHPPSRSLNSALFLREDNLDIPSSSHSSVYSSPFSDVESEISELSEVSFSHGVQRKTSGPHESAYANDMYHERKLSGSSSESLSSFSPSPKPKPPPRPAPNAPPRPPRRPNSLPLNQDPSVTTLATPNPTKPIAPPLPLRPTLQEESGPEFLSSAPPLPARLSPAQGAPVEILSPVAERKPLGNTKLPPPPTRVIGLGDKLPPMRRPPSPSSEEESGSEEDPRLRSAETLPDSSRSSRRPPSVPSSNFMEYKMHVPAHSGHVMVAGTGVVVASGHHVKYYSLSSDEGLEWSLDTRDGMRSAQVSCLEFRPARDEADRGKYLWLGTKEGHLFELDIRMGVITSSKMSIHASQITNIFRHGSRMITVDEGGKTCIFDPNNNATAGLGASHVDDVNLVYTAPRIYRLGEKVEFVKLLDGLMWTAHRTDANGIGTASVPVLRVYDIYAPGSVGRAVMPTQHAGAVTSGTILPSHPHHVYLGHEGGYISIWNVATGDGVPACVEVVKVSVSDVLCLEGVNDRLWVGGRKGTIAVYDVSAKPWVVTNCWDAHGGLPVSRIFADPYAIVEMGKLIVVSVGRDEQIRFWDGLLGADRIEQELLKREHAFSTFRDLKILIISWNVDAAKPDSLSGDLENVQFLHDVLTSVNSPDIISFGFQEVIDLESRSMAAKTVLLGGKKKGDEGKINEKVTSSYKRWYDRLVHAVRLAMPPESPYTVVHTESLVGLFTCMFVKNGECVALKDAAIATIKRGMGGRYGNKGGIIARFVIDDSSLCFINCHLAAGQHHVRQRNADVAAFLEETNVFPAEHNHQEFGYVGGGDGSMVLDHEIVFLNGDMNYRIDQRRDAVVAAIEANELEALRVHDQLHKEMKHNRAFRLRGFREGPLTFAPTYKYDRGSNVFDTSEKRRVPAWCDRVLWRTRASDSDVDSEGEERVVSEGYRRWEVNVSDHRPVSAAFRVRVKKVVGEARERERVGLEEWWRGLERVLLEESRAFYVARAMV